MLLLGVALSAAERGFPLGLRWGLLQLRVLLLGGWGCEGVAEVGGGGDGLGGRGLVLLLGGHCGWCLWVRLVGAFSDREGGFLVHSMYGFFVKILWRIFSSIRLRVCRGRGVVS